MCFITLMVWVGLDWWGCLYMVFLFCFEGFGGLLWNCLLVWLVCCFGLPFELVWLVGLRFCWVCAWCCELMFITFVI